MRRRNRLGTILRVIYGPLDVEQYHCYSRQPLSKKHAERKDNAAQAESLVLIGRSCGRRNTSTSLREARLTPVEEVVWRFRYLVAKFVVQLCRRGLLQIWSLPQLPRMRYGSQIGLSHELSQGLVTAYYRAEACGTVLMGQPEVRKSSFIRAMVLLQPSEQLVSQYDRIQVMAFLKSPRVRTSISRSTKERWRGVCTGFWAV